MKVGITLPTFTADRTLTVRAAKAATAAGLDGVFLFDHLWPMGSPGRPALACLPGMAAVAVATQRVIVGPLVARVGLLSDDWLIDGLNTVGVIAGPGRLLVGLGTGDRLSAAENVAYGLDVPPAEARLAHLGQLARQLVDAGKPVWIGGRSPAVRRLAAEVGVPVNMWGVPVDEVRAMSQPCTWGGQVLVGADDAEAERLLKRYGGRPGLVHGSIRRVAEHCAELARAGVTWIVAAPLDVGDQPEVAVQNMAGVRQALALA